METIMDLSPNALSIHGKLEAIQEEMRNLEDRIKNPNVPESKKEACCARLRDLENRVVPRYRNLMY